MPEEALYLLQQAQSTTILASPEYLPLANQIRVYAASHSDSNILTLPIVITASAPQIFPSNPSLKLDPALEISPDRPALLINTSGTSRAPKGVVHTHRLIHSIHRDTKPSQVFLSHSRPIWISGVLPLIRHPLAGARLEIVECKPALLWERLRQGGVTYFAAPPRFWTQMMMYYNQTLVEEKKLSANELDEYMRGVRGLEVARVGSLVSPRNMLKFWQEKAGRALQVSYAATEFPGKGLKTTKDTDFNLEGCVGRPLPGVEIRLSQGDHGEILIKAPTMFSHYLGDEAKTRASFTEDGYFRTGDAAHRVGEDYVLDGRVTVEFIRYRGLKISILEVELRLLELPFISDACIVPVWDVAVDTRVAALVRFIPQLTSSPPSLQCIRASLSQTLPASMLPTLLRVLCDDEEIPRTHSEKVMRAKASELYFPMSDQYELSDDVEQWNSDDEGDGDGQPTGDGIPIPTRKAWDWNGLPE